MQRRDKTTSFSLVPPFWVRAGRYRDGALSDPSSHDSPMFKQQSCKSRSSRGGANVISLQSSVVCVCV